MLGKIIATVFVSEISISFARQFGSLPKLTAGLARLLMRALGVGVWMCGMGGLKRARVAWLGHREIFFFFNKDWCSRVNELHPIFDSPLGFLLYLFLPFSLYAVQYRRQSGSKAGERWGDGIRKDNKPGLELCCPKHNHAICWSCRFDFKSLNFTLSQWEGHYFVM